MSIAVVTEARERLSKQKHLGKVKGGNAEECFDINCTCVGLALYDAAKNAGIDQKERDNLCRRFLIANKINEKPGQWISLELIAEWNDAPKRTLAEAVAALDKLIDFLGSEGEG
jgi:hypothetical protein